MKSDSKRENVEKKKYSFAICAAGDGEKKGTFDSVSNLKFLFTQWSYSGPLKRYLSSGIRVSMLQLYLIFPISLNVPTTLPYNTV